MSAQPTIAVTTVASATTDPFPAVDAYCARNSDSDKCSLRLTRTHSTVIACNDRNTNAISTPQSSVPQNFQCAGDATSVDVAGLMLFCTAAPGQPAIHTGSHNRLGRRSHIDAPRALQRGTPSKKSTTPVSSEYSAPTTSRPSLRIRRSSTSEP